MFEDILGNEQAKQYLTHTAAKGRIGNPLLFAGLEGIGKSLFAEAFAKLLLCQDDLYGFHRKKIETGNHPDIRIYRPEGKLGMHSINVMRQFNEEVYLAPYEAKWKVFIIHEADRMLTYSANALLKTFEEPAHDAVIVLLSSAPQALLPTILSRCRPVHFHPLSENEIVSYIVNHCQKSSEEAYTIACMAQGSLGRAIQLAREGGSPLRSLILNMLSKGGVIAYKGLADTAAFIAEQIESKKKEIEVDIRTTLLRGFGDDLSATQKQGIEKEVEGALAMYTVQEAHVLFEVILAWYRDMHLLSVNSNRAYLIHGDYAAACSQAFERGEIIPLETVQKAVSAARLALERSTSLHICFENLFLKCTLPWSKSH